jgi:hypothetical protein
MSKQSERKKKRRAKRNGRKKSPKRLSSSLNELAWKMARAMTKIEPDREYTNRKSHCDKCGQTFCLGFDNVEQSCKDCFYHPCPKEMAFHRNCRNCGE